MDAESSARVPLLSVEDESVALDGGVELNGEQTARTVTSPSLLGGVSTCSSSTGLSFLDDYEIADGAVLQMMALRDNHQMRGIVHVCSSNSARMLVGFNEGSVRVIDLTGRKRWQTLKMRDATVSGCCFKGDSDDTILCVDADGLLCAWQESENGATWERVLECQVLDVDKLNAKRRHFWFSSDGTYLVHASCYKTKYDKSKLQMDGNNKVHLFWYDVSGVPQGPPVEVKQMEICDLPSYCRQIRFSPSGRGVLIGQVDHTVVWPDVFEFQGRVKVTAGYGTWLSDGRMVGTTDKGNNQSYIWDVQDALPSIAEINPMCRIQGEIVAHGGGTLLVQNHDGAEDFTVWSLDNGCPIGHFTCPMNGTQKSGTQNFVPCVNEEGHLIGMCAGDVLSVWDVHHCVRIFETRIVHWCMGEVGNKSLFFIHGCQRLMLLTTSKCVVLRLGVFEREGNLVYENVGKRITDEVNFCKMSPDGNKIGVLSFENSAKSLWIQNLEMDKSIRIQSEKEISFFCFSVVGDGVVTTGQEGSIELWNIDWIDGKIKNHDVIGNMQGMQSVLHKLIPGKVSLALFDIAFTTEGGEMEVLVALCKGCFVWVDMNGQVVDVVERTEAGFTLKHRFASNGSRCVILSGQRGEHDILKSLECEVWDLVNRSKLRTVDISSSAFQPKTWEIKLCNSQALSFDGRCIALGVNERMEPWLLTPNLESDKKHHKVSFKCEVDDYGRFCIMGPIGVLSEDGRHVVTFTNLSEEEGCIMVQEVGVGVDGPDACVKKIHFPTNGESKGVLLMSGDGRRIARVTKSKIQFWDPFSDQRCLPDYDKWKESMEGGVGDPINACLDKYGVNLLNYPDRNGWSWLGRAVEARDVECATTILDWAKKNEGVAYIGIGIGTGSEDPRWSNLLQLAIDKRVPECVNLLLHAILHKVAFHGREGSLREALGQILQVYPTMFEDIIQDPKMLQEKREVLVPIGTFKKAPFFVCTSDEYSPQNVGELWSSPPQVLMQSTVLNVLRRLKFWGTKKKRDEDGGLLIRAESSVIPIENFAQVGKGSLFGEFIVEGLEPKAFTSMSLECLIHYKWGAYAKDMVFGDMCMFGLLLVVFTAYCILLAQVCPVDQGRNAAIELASDVTLILSMILCALGLFGEIKQIVAYWKLGRGMSYYLLRSKWNALELITYLLVTFVIPFFHFLSDPCHNDLLMLSWVVPLSSILLWWKTLYYAQAFRTTGTTVLMIFAIMRDIQSFLLIGFGVLFGFSIAFYVLYRNDEYNMETYGSVGRSMLMTFGMMLGAFELEAMTNGRSAPMGIFFFVVFVLIMMVILLNLLIAIMNHQFDTIKETEDAQFQYVRALIIDDIESTMSRKELRTIKQGIGRFVHVLLPKDIVAEAGGWQSRMLEMEARLRTMVDESLIAIDGNMEDRIGQMLTAIEEKLMNSGQQSTSLDARVAKVETKLAGVESLMQRIEYILKGRMGMQRFIGHEQV